jgi:hypothetical protein
MIVVGVPLGGASMMTSETHPIISWVLGWAAVVVAIAGHAVVAWKMEQDYHQR